MRILIDSGYLGDRYEVDTYYYWCLLSGFVLAVLIPWGYSASRLNGFVDEAVCRTIEDLGFICRQKKRDFFLLHGVQTDTRVNPAPVHWLQGPFPRG